MSAIHVRTAPARLAFQTACFAGAVWLAGAGCAATGEDGGDGVDGSGGSSSGAGSNNGSGGDVNDDLTNPGSGGGSSTQNDTCASSVVEAAAVPLNMFIMFDKSGSMDGSKWNNATAALKNFFQDPGTDGLQVALRFFHDGLCSKGICDINACSQPLVDIGVLSAEPGDPHEQALVSAVNSKSPGGGGGTPTYAALAGAENWAKAYKDAHPVEPVVVVLVTDGSPNGCIENFALIANLATDARNTHGILTYSVGLEGSNESEMNMLAQAGGTGQAYFIGTGSAESELLAALQAINVEQTLACEFLMPEGENVDPSLVNVDFTSGAGQTDTIGQVPDAASCEQGGWHYDDADNPTKIVLCPSTCDGVQGDADASVEIVLGCDTIVAEVN